MQIYKESKTRRKERIANISCLRTKVIESKKLYNRNKVKQNLRKNTD